MPPDPVDGWHWRAAHLCKRPKSPLTYFQPCCILGILHCIQSCVPAPADSRQEKPIGGLPSAEQKGNEPVFDMGVGQRWRRYERHGSVGFDLFHAPPHNTVFELCVPVISEACLALHDFQREAIYSE